MAPIQPALTGTPNTAWLYIIAVLAFLLFGVVAIWVIKALKSRLRSRENVEDSKMVSATHVDSYDQRDVLLPIWRPEVRKAIIDIRNEMREVLLADTAVVEKNAADIEPSGSMDLPMQIPHSSWESQLDLQSEVPPPIAGHHQVDPKQFDTQAQGMQAGSVEAVHIEEQAAVEEVVVIGVQGVEEDITGDPSCGTPTDILDGFMATYDDSLELEKQADAAILSPGMHTPSLSDTSSDIDDDGSPPHTPSLPDLNPLNYCKSAPAVLALWFTSRELEHKEHTDEVAEIEVSYAPEADQPYMPDGQNMDPVEEVIARVTSFTPCKAQPVTSGPQGTFDESLTPVDSIDARIASITGSPLKEDDTEELDQIDSLIAAVTGYGSPQSQYRPSPESQLDSVDAKIMQATGHSPPACLSWTESLFMSPSPCKVPFTPAMLFAPHLPLAAPSTPTFGSPAQFWAYQAQQFSTTRPLSGCLADPNSYAIANDARLFTPLPRQPSGKIRITYDPTSTPTRTDRAKRRMLSPRPCV
ncbi:hypothetical protein BDW22DRAFT_1421982 [Trametopsis cervina]|nr:hypothetical protein BDW22DRAFT_1421982 [Trametopsis cervina]